MRFKDSKKQWLKNRLSRLKSKKNARKKQRILIKTLKMAKVACRYLKGIGIRNSKV